MRKLLGALKCFFFHWNHDSEWTDEATKTGVTSSCKVCGRVWKL